MRSTSLRARAAALVVLALTTPGCVTGHLLDAARRRDLPVSVDEAALDGDRIVLGYAAVVVDDRGRPCGGRARRAAIPLAALRRGGLAAGAGGASAIERLPTAAPLPGITLPLVRGGAAHPAPPFVELADPDAGGATFLRLHEAGAGATAALPVAALTEIRTEPWVYALVPLSTAFDLATVPPLLLLGVPLLVFGD